MPSWWGISREFLVQDPSAAILPFGFKGWSHGYWCFLYCSTIRKKQQDPRFLHVKGTAYTDHSVLLWGGHMGIDVSYIVRWLKRNIKTHIFFYVKATAYELWSRYWAKWKSCWSFKQWSPPSLTWSWTKSYREFSSFTKLRTLLWGHEARKCETLQHIKQLSFGEGDLGRSLKVSHW